MFDIELFDSICKQYGIVKIPNNATNGDVIKAMFPNCNFHEYYSVYKDFFDNQCQLEAKWDWWNAQYERGTEE